MNTHRLGRAGVAAAILTLVPAPVATADRGHPRDDPHLVGRAVLPVETYAPGPPSGSGLVPAGQTETVINGVHFPTPSQPVEGFSAIVDGRHRGEYLMMPDNGFGGKANSRDFLIRAYYVEPDFKTDKGGSGTVAVRDFIQFADPDGSDRVPDRARGHGRTLVDRRRHRPGVGAARSPGRPVDR